MGVEFVCLFAGEETFGASTGTVNFCACSTESVALMARHSQDPAHFLPNTPSSPHSTLDQASEGWYAALSYKVRGITCFTLAENILLACRADDALCLVQGAIPRMLASSLT